MSKHKNILNIYNKFAVPYQKKFMDMDLYHDTLDLFCSLVEKKDAEVFEIACGPGNITKYLLTKRPDFKIFGIDFASNMIDLARINNPTARFEIMDGKEINKIDKKFNAVMCGFCLPYLSKEEAIQLIDDVYNLLESEGVFYLSTMEDDYNKSGYEGSSFGGEDKLYIYYHQADYLLKSLKNSGFKIIDLQYKNYPEKDGTITKDLIITAKKPENNDVYKV